MQRAQPGAMIGGKYRLERPIAEGGMGSVWLAWQAGLDRWVAIKFMAGDLAASPLAWARFDREARAAAQIRTPHVVQIHDHGIEGDVPYMVMELLEGEDLSTRLGRGRRLSLPDAARILTQAAKALRRAHELGIVHRDLKPANLFLARGDDEEIVKILDFGIARSVGPTTSPGGPDATQTGSIVGSPHYMSPEQARGAKDIDQRSDLWSLGVILFRAVTGQLPFPGDQIGDIIIRVGTAPAPVPTSIAPDLPPAMDAFFAKALAKEPDARFQSAGEMVSAFLAAAGLSTWPSSTGEHLRVVPAVATSQPSLPGLVAPPAPVAPRPADAAASTLQTSGASVELPPRPSSSPVWAIAVASIALLTAACGVIVFLLVRGGATSPAPRPDAAPASTPAAAVTAAAATAPSVAPAATSEPVAASASASAGKTPPTAGSGRRKHDFGY